MELKGCLTRLFFLDTTKMKALILGSNVQDRADDTASAAVREQRRRAQYRDVVARCEGGAVKRARKGAAVDKSDRDQIARKPRPPKARLVFGDAAHAKQALLPS